MRFFVHFTLISLALMGCERKSRLSQMSDYELSKRHDICLDKKPSAPGHAQACENIRRECERRKEELGTYVCSHH